MKNLFDAIQTLITLPGFAFAGCVVVALALMQIAKIAGLAVTIAKHILPRSSRANALKALFIALALYLLRQHVSAALQYVEQAYIGPVYYTTDTSSSAVAAFEMELQRYTSPAEFNAVVSATKEIAQSVGSTPLAFYEVYLSECGMNPFACNAPGSDTVAAGIIQFTKAGVSGLYLDGAPVEFADVKNAITRRDIGYIMRLTGAYIARAANGHTLPRSCDVYTAVFMPAFVGDNDNTVLASVNSSRPDFYFQNAGLDGYRLEQSGRIIKMQAYRDGQITPQDLALVLAAKKSALLAKYSR